MNNEAKSVVDCLKGIIAILGACVIMLMGGLTIYYHLSGEMLTGMFIGIVSLPLIGLLIIALHYRKQLCVRTEK